MFVRNARDILHVSVLPVHGITLSAQRLWLQLRPRWSTQQHHQHARPAPGLQSLRAPTSHDWRRDRASQNAWPPAASVSYVALESTAFVFRPLPSMMRFSSAIESGVGRLE
jgi:hypothetical protein